MGSGSWVRRGVWIGTWLAFSLACAIVAMHAFAYLQAEINLRNPFHRSFASAGLSVPLHFHAAGLALLLAPLQLVGAIRQRWPALHRLVGWLYVLAVLLAGVAGLMLAPRAQGGWATGASFLLLALSWLTCTGLAVWHAVRRKVEAHRRWMLRSIALTFAAVSLRVYLGLGLALLQLKFLTAYLIAAWLCWTLNLLVVELWLRWRPTQPAPGRCWVSHPSGA